MRKRAGKGNREEGREREREEEGEDEEERESTEGGDRRERGNPNTRA